MRATKGCMKTEYPLTALEMLAAIIAEPGRIAEDRYGAREQYRVNLGSLEARSCVPGANWRRSALIVCSTPDRYRLLPLTEKLEPVELAPEILEAIIDVTDAIKDGRKAKADHELSDAFGLVIAQAIRDARGEK